MNFFRKKIVLAFISVFCLSLFSFPAFSAVSNVQAPDDLGLAPNGGIDITTIDITNDTSMDRPDELSFSGIPVAKNLNLLNTDTLALIGPGNRLLNSQFRVLSRWAGGPSDTTKPIRWIEVSVRANVPANSTVNYVLRKYPNSVQRAANLLTSNGIVHTINTESSSFTLDESLAGVFKTMTIGNNQVYENSKFSGPLMLTRDNKALYGKADINGFKVEENGPVKAIIKSSGHFAKGATSACSLPLAYDVWMTFVKGSSNVNMEFYLRNECGDGFSVAMDWENTRHLFKEVFWNYPLTMGAPKVYIANDERVFTSGSNFNGISRVDQLKGDLSNQGWRKATIKIGYKTVDTKTAYEKPFLAVSDGSISAGIYMPWMQYREPQALLSQSKILSIRFVGGEDGLGEGQSKWNLAQLRFFNGNPSNQNVVDQRDKSDVEMSRPLLVHVSPEYTNSTKIMLRLPEEETSANLTSYLNLLDQIHNDTINGKWDRQKVYGMIWPDIDRERWGVSYDSPAEYRPDSNYWSPTKTELLEFVRSGDPKWMHDFSKSAELTFLHHAIYNLNGRDLPNEILSGFGVGSGSTNNQPGSIYRSGVSSDDYLYNQGSGIFYALSPSYAAEEVFAEGCKTFIKRYSAPRNQGDQYVSQLNINRQIVQHVNMLRYAAEYVRDPVLNAQCTNKLNEVMQEYAEDNLAGGIVCERDSGNAQSCSTAELFMYSALQQQMFVDYLLNYGDRNITVNGTQITGVIKRAIRTMGDQIYKTLMAKDSAGNILVNNNWENVLNCTFSNNGAQLNNCNGIHYDEPLYSQTKPLHVSTLLIANGLDESLGLGDFAAKALANSWNIDDFYTYFTGGDGWQKGAAEAMQNVIYGIGAAELYSVGDGLSGSGSGGQSGNTGGTGGTTGGAIGGTTGGTTGGATGGATGGTTGGTTGGATGGTAGGATGGTTGGTTGGATGGTAGGSASVQLSGLPSTTYTLQSGEQLILGQAEPQYGDFYVDNYVGNMGTSSGYAPSYCWGDDFVKYDLYIALQGASEFTWIGTHTGAGENMTYQNGTSMSTDGCAKGRFIYDLNLPTGTHQIGYCATNVNNLTQRVCNTLTIVK